MIANHYLCRVGGAQHKMAGIGGVTPCRSSAAAAPSAPSSEMFQDLKSKGFVLSGLYPFSHAFYRKFGYEISYTFDYYRLPVSELLGYPSPRAPTWPWHPSAWTRCAPSTRPFARSAA